MCCCSCSHFLLHRGRHLPTSPSPQIPGNLMSSVLLQINNVLSLNTDLLSSNTYECTLWEGYVLFLNDSYECNKYDHHVCLYGVVQVNMSSTCLVIWVTFSLYVWLKETFVWMFCRCPAMLYFWRTNKLAIKAWFILTCPTWRAARESTSSSPTDISTAPDHLCSSTMCWTQEENTSSWPCWSHNDANLAYILKLLQNVQCAKLMSL